MSSDVEKKDIARETVGYHSARLAEKAPEQTTAIDQMQEQLEDYDKNIYECIATHKKIFDGDFYVVVITKKEKLMQNVLRSYFFARQSCPTPDYDQAVYKYEPSGENLYLMWVLPAVDVVRFMVRNQSLVKPEQYELLGYVLKFVDGSLLKYVKELNKERHDSNILEH